MRKKSLTQLDTVELQWLEHQWLLYHACLEPVLGCLGKNPIAAHIIIFRIIKDDFLYYIDNGMVCVLIRIASTRQF